MQRKMPLLLEVIVIIFCFYLLTNIFFGLLTPDKEYQKVSYNEFQEKINNSEVDTVYLTNSDGETLYFSLKGDAVDLKDKEIQYTDNPGYEDFKKELLEAKVNIGDQKDLSSIGIKTSTGDDSSAFEMLMNIFVLIMLLATPLLMVKLMTSRNEESIAINKLLDMGSNTKEFTKDTSSQNDSFSNILGLKEVKKDMMSLVDFIKNKEKYIEAGAELPKGVILYGPPGTGKTMLARAVANEAGVPFFYQCGSDFVEKYVGVGAERIRKLFKSAKENAPCIIFIDEIDAIGGSRDGYSNNSEDLKTLNALLSEMDGFSKVDNILVIATTNRLESLDPALLRAGRFTNKYCVPLPETPEERREIIEFYLKNKKLSDDVDIETLAKNTIGCSPADIKAIINEAAIISVQNGFNYITNKMFDDAMMKSIMKGHLKEEQTNRDKKELEIVSVHEAGHALLGKLMGHDVTKVTILASTNGAGGVTFTVPEKMGLHTVDELKQEVIELYGGRAAEKFMFGENNITTGASNDIEKATNIIHEIISSYGFNDKYGMLNLNDLKIDSKSYLEEEVSLAKELENKADEMIKNNKDKLIAISKLLLKKETIFSDDLDSIINPVLSE